MWIHLYMQRQYKIVQLGNKKVKGILDMRFFFNS